MAGMAAMRSVTGMGVMLVMMMRVPRVMLLVYVVPGVVVPGMHRIGVHVVVRYGICPGQMVLMLVRLFRILLRHTACLIGRWMAHRAPCRIPP